MLKFISAISRLIPTNRIPFNIPKWHLVEKSTSYFSNSDTNFSFNSNYGNIKWSAKGFPDLLTRHMLFEGYYQLDVLVFIHEYLKPGDTFLDVGGHHGLMAIIAAKSVGENGKVVTFEPNPYASSFIELHRELNDVSNLKIENIGLSNKQGQVDFYIQKGDVTWNSTIIPEFIELNTQDSVEKKSIRIDTLDNYIEAFNLSPKAIKIDVEGAELLILEGAQKTLDTLRPVISMEFNPVSAKAANSTIENYLDMLAEKGYVLLVLKKDLLGYYSIYNHEPFSINIHCKEDQLKNVLCVPKEKLNAFSK